LRQLLFLRYVDNLKPREISALDPEHYPDTAAVHQALERIMKRLRRRVDQYITRCL
jgi:DNA-directed RNA polymerase specialized sigma24 family protein